MAEAIPQSTGRLLIESARRELPDEWPKLQSISRTLGRAGHRVVLVGGAVRNLVLGRKPSDLDLASDASPQEIMALFRHVIPTGIQHGTVTIMVGRSGFEITTFRLDGEYSDSRRPDSVEFTQDLLLDLDRRDFTINAMALDLEAMSLVDPHHGQEDLRRRLIRTVGQPVERFTEDSLRIVRAIRFMCQLGFEIEAHTMEAMRSMGHRLAAVSVERFREELAKILVSTRAARGLTLLHACGILRIYFKDLDFSGLQPGILDFGQVDLGPASFAYRLALTCIPFLPRSQDPALGSRLLEGLLRSLKTSRHDLATVLGCLALEPYGDSPPASWSPSRWRRFIGQCGRESAMDGLLYLAARFGSPWVDGRLDQWQAILGQMLASKSPCLLSDLALDGRTLIAWGLPQGPRLGRILQALLDAVIENPELNQEQTLLDLARSLVETPDAG